MCINNAIAISTYKYVVDDDDQPLSHINYPVVHIYAHLRNACANIFFDVVVVALLRCARRRSMKSMRVRIIINICVRSNNTSSNVMTSQRVFLFITQIAHSTCRVEEDDDKERHNSNINNGG